MGKITILVLILTLAMFSASCFRIVARNSHDGKGTPGTGKMISEQEASNIATATITTDFPDLVDAEKRNQSYSSKGREFYEFTYKRIVQVETDNGTLKIPRIVIVTIDKSTGEKSVAVSR